MNRHHPYGSFDSHPARRGASPPGPGPDRYHRYSDRGGPPMRGRGFGRGRGGYNNYDGNMSQHDPYDQGHSQVNMGPYGDYEPSAPPPQNSYYNNYGSPSTPYGQPHDAAYNQDYYKNEDGPGPSYNDDGFSRGGGPRRPIRKERDDKVHDSIIEERIQRERPCRTLFIRNIKYETNSDDVRALFEEHGEIKTFFDLISTRGMVFVTYFDLRAAERARDRLQGSEISGRPIDVHYSLPRDDNNRGNEREKNQQLQGNLIVTLRNSPSGAPLDDNEVRKKFQQFGDVKSVKPVDNHSSDSRYVEFYDTRACEEAFDRLRHQSLQDGVMDIVLAWDTSEASQGQPRERTEWSDGLYNNRGGRGRGRGGFNRGRGRGGGGSFNEDDGGRYGGGDDYGRFGGRGGGRGGRHDDYDGGGGRGMGRGRGYGNRYDRGGGGGGYGDSGPPGGGYGGPSSGYGGPPPMIQPQAPPPPSSASMAPSASDGERLEQARKVQQLLAALKQPASGAPPGPGPPTVGAAPGILPPPPAGSAPYYGAPPNSAAMPPYPPYGGVTAPSQPPAPVQPQIPPPVSSTPPVGGPPPMAALSGLPPNILSLMQSAQQQQRPGGPPGQYGSMMMQPLNGSAAGVPPQGASAQSQAQYQQLMSYLQTQAAGGAPKQ